MRAIIDVAAWPVFSTLTGSTRSGLYKLKSYPASIGKEIAGTIAALPTDPTVLNNEVYKSQGFKVGGKIAAVSGFSQIAGGGDGDGKTRS